MISDDAPDALAPYAIKKPQKKQYVELWYFTGEGQRDETYTLEHGSTKDTLTLVQEGYGVGLQKVSTLTASKRAQKDEQLSWNQFTYATTEYLDQMSVTG